MCLDRPLMAGYKQREIKMQRLRELHCQAEMIPWKKSLSLTHYLVHAQATTCPADVGAYVCRLLVRGDSLPITYPYHVSLSVGSYPSQLSLPFPPIPTLGSSLTTVSLLSALTGPLALIR